MTPRSDNRLKKGANVAEKLVPNLARRTARSGLNNYVSTARSLIALLERGGVLKDPEAYGFAKSEYEPIPSIRFAQSAGPGLGPVFLPLWLPF